MTTKQRPLVVLGGWLGCQLRYLQRYEALYDSLGYETLSVIPSPQVVANTCLSPSSVAHFPSNNTRNWATSPRPIKSTRKN